MKEYVPSVGVELVQAVADGVDDTFGSEARLNYGGITR